MSHTSYPSPASSVVDSAPTPESLFSRLSAQHTPLTPYSLQLLNAARHYPNSDNSGFGPRHHAILLAGSPSTDEPQEHDNMFDFERLRSALPAQPNEDGQWPARSPLSSISESIGNTPPPAPFLPTISLRSPVSPPQRLPRRSVLDSSAVLRREMTGTSSNVNRRMIQIQDLLSNYPSTDFVASPVSTSSPDVVDSTESEIRALIRQRRTDPISLSSIEETVRRARQGLGRSLDAQTSTRNVNNPSEPITTSSHIPPRIPPYRAARRSNPSAQSPVSGRLSTLSNMGSMHNFSNPASPFQFASALLPQETGVGVISADIFEEPSSYDQLEPQPIEEASSPDSPSREYYDPDSDPWSWQMPAPARVGGPTRMRRTSRREANTVSSSTIPILPYEPPYHIPPPLPRLDPDGNEVPWHEEEFAVNRAAPRSRSLAQRLGQGVTDAHVLAQSRFPYLVPVTQASISHDDNPPMLNLPIRVNLNSRANDYADYGHPTQDPSNGYLDYVFANPEKNESICFGSRTPFYVDPLPMSLESMITHKPHGLSSLPPRPVIYAHKEASLAGR